MEQTSQVVLSIIVPVFNEKFTVEQLLDEVSRAPLPEGVGREIIVVDDASTDGTWDILQRRAGGVGGVKLLRHERNRGKGAAIRTALKQVTGDYVVLQDADLEYSPSEYAKLLKPLLDGAADVVYGSRFLPSECKRVLFFWHSLGNKLLTALSNMLTNLDLTDMETCYKMARSSILKSIPIRSNRFGIEPELTAKFAKRGCRIFEVPISYYGRTYAEGKKITWRDGVTALFVMLYFRLVDDLYAEDYGHDILNSLTATQRFNRWMADAIRPWVGDDVLEVGAGLGNLTRQLLPRNSYVVSDVDALYLEYLRNVFGRNRRMEVVKADLASGEDFEPLAGRFDTAICLNVLEHVQDDHRALGNLFGALRPGGRACILVPAGPRRYGSLDEALGHARRYDETGLRKAMEGAGFQIEHLAWFNRIGVPGWWLNAKVLQRRRFGKVQLKLFDSTIWLWRHVDRWLPWPGLSLIAVGRKP